MEKWGQETFVLEMKDTISRLSLCYGRGSREDYGYGPPIPSTSLHYCVGAPLFYFS